MRKSTGVGLLIVLLISVLCASGIHALGGKAGDKLIRSASELNYYPFCIVNDNGEADGFSVELLRYSLQAVGLNVTFYVAPWDQIKQDLADGKIQVLPLVGRTPEREAVYDFTFPYLTFYGAIFVRKGDARIRTLDDLADKEVLVMKGDNAEEYARREKVSGNIIATETYEEAFQLLSEGSHDAVIAQEYMGKNTLKRMGIGSIVPAVRLGRFKQDFTFAVKEGDAELLSKLEEGLSAVILDGTFDRLYDRWFTKEPETISAPEEKTNKGYVWAIAIGIILAVIMAVVSVTLAARKKHEHA